MRLNVQKYKMIVAKKGIADEIIRKGIGMCKTTFSQLVSGNLGGITIEAMEGIAEVLGCSVGDIASSDLDEGENMIEWTVDAERATLTFSQQRMITRVKKLAEKYPDDVTIVAENTSGRKVLYAYVPTAWIQINRPKKMNFSEEDLQLRSERLKQLHNVRRTDVRIGN